MDTLRAVATSVARRAARSRPMAFLHAEERRSDERGQGMAEYALILGLIAIVAIASLIFLGDTISDLFWAPISEDFGKVLDDILGGGGGGGG